jgi:hypothetical protein
MWRFGFGLSAALFFLATPAAAEIVTVCALPSRPVTPVAAFLQGILPSQAPRQIALLRDEQGYDIVLNWRDAGEQSLRGTGADIMGLPLGGDAVHLMVSREREGLEHFLFTLDHGEGELLQSHESETGSEEPGTRAVCVAPR